MPSKHLITIKTPDGTLTHLKGPGTGMADTLCGMAANDSYLGYEELDTPKGQKANCDDCGEIVWYCRHKSRLIEK